MGKSLRVLLFATLLLAMAWGTFSVADQQEPLGGLPPRSYVNISGDFYYISPAGVGYTALEASNVCNDDGMKVVGFETPEKYDLIREYLVANGEGSGEFWTSGRKLGSTFIWGGSGQLFSYHRWFAASGEPDFRGDADPCVTFIANNGWYDEHFSFKARLLCEQAVKCV